MSKVLLIVRNITKNVMFKLCDLNSVTEKEVDRDIKVIRRSISDVSNRSYCASSLKFDNNYREQKNSKKNF